MKGLRIMLNHKLDGRIFDGYSNAMVRPDIQKGVSGERPIGRVLHAWINPANGGLYWAGELKFYDDEQELIMLFKDGYLSECSLHHTVEDPVVGGLTKTHKIRLVELSLCFKGARAGSVVVTGPSVFAYMRNTGFKGHHNNKIPGMESANETIVVAESAPVTNDVSSEQRGHKRSGDEAGLTEQPGMDLRKVLESSSPEQIRLIQDVIGRAQQAEEKAAKLDAEVIRSKKEASEASLATQELFRQAWNQFNQVAPISTSTISIAASAAAASGPEESSKFHANLVKATAELHATMTAVHQQQIQQAKQIPARSQEVDDILRGLSRQGYNTASAIKSANTSSLFPGNNGGGSSYLNTPMRASDVSIAASASNLNMPAQQQAPAVQQSRSMDISSIPRGNGGYAAIENFLVGRYDIPQ